MSSCQCHSTHNRSVSTYKCELLCADDTKKPQGTTCTAPCMANCSKCGGDTIYDCLECAGSYEKRHWTEAFPHKNYYDTRLSFCGCADRKKFVRFDNGACEACDNSCAECFGPSKFDCLKCAPRYEKIDRVDGDKITTTCECRKGYIYNYATNECDLLGVFSQCSYN
jgi:proprotein convertase subtilisin/kexin type 5